MNVLASLLLDAGLIQFGWFHQGHTTLPFSVELEMLASYPAVLQAVVERAQTALDGLAVTRLLCRADALPFGVAYALRSGIPLVYSRSSTQELVFDLVGAYDIGHPTLLLANTVDGALPNLIAGARRVGLEVSAVVTLLELRPVAAAGEVRVVPLLRLGDLVREAVQDGRLVPAHAQALQAWIDG